MKFAVTILGSGASMPTMKRSSSAQVLNVDEKLYLIDCGEGTQINLRKNKIKLQRINSIFISHLHGDHFFGLIGLISTLHLLGRKSLLKIVAPKEIKDVIEMQLEVSNTTLQYPIVYFLLENNFTGEVYSDKSLMVKAFLLNHQIPTWGFVFSEKKRSKNISKSFVAKYRPDPEEIIKIKNGDDYIDEDGKLHLNNTITKESKSPRKYAYCSDTKYDDSIIPHIEKADLLYHEATFGNEMQSIAIEKFHSTAEEAARIAKIAKVKNLVIGHFSARYKKVDNLVNEAMPVFSKIIVAEDGDTIDI